LIVELTIAGEMSPLKMRGCGLAVINPPWQFEATARFIVEQLRPLLQQSDGGGSLVRWIVPEK
jgi:23S rRNA (adenine2030-N6)-methyltransferase